MIVGLDVMKYFHLIHGCSYSHVLSDWFIHV